MAEAWFYQLKPSGCVFHPVNARRSGGVSIGGSEQVVGSGGGRWRATVTIPVWDEDNILAYRAMQAAVLGLNGDILVPCIAPWRPYNANGAMASMSVAGGVGGRSLFDHSGLAAAEPVQMRVAQMAPVRSTRLVLRHPDVPPLRAGHYFGIGERLYLVARTWLLDRQRVISADDPVVWGSDAVTWGDDPVVWGDGAGTVVGTNIEAVEFWPPLREAVQANTPLILGRPVCKMRPASEDTGVLDLGLGISGMPSIDFVEVGV